jgi:hypothetical protein
MRKVNTDGIKIGFQRMGLVFKTDGEEEDVNAQAVFNYHNTFK